MRCNSLQFWSRSARLPARLLLHAPRRIAFEPHRLGVDGDHVRDDCHTQIVGKVAVVVKSRIRCRLPRPLRTTKRDEPLCRRIGDNAVRFVSRSTVLDTSGRRTEDCSDVLLGLGPQSMIHRPTLKRVEGIMAHRPAISLNQQLAAAQSRRDHFCVVPSRSLKVKLVSSLDIVDDVACGKLRPILRSRESTDPWRAHCAPQRSKVRR